jgi:putative endonuclease
LEKRVSERQAGTYDGYTAQSPAGKLVFQLAFERVDEAIAAERQIKGWRGAKKEALIRGDYAALPPPASRARKAELGPPP